MPRGTINGRLAAVTLLPRIGITEGNRQPLTLGMLILQLIDPERYNALPLLWEGDAPPGERLADWVRKEWEHKPHEGETPVGVPAEVTEAVAQALAAAEAAGPSVKQDREEYQRLVNDMRDGGAVPVLRRQDALRRAGFAIRLQS